MLELLGTSIRETGREGARTAFSGGLVIMLLFAMLAMLASAKC